MSSPEPHPEGRPPAGRGPQPFYEPGLDSLRLFAFLGVFVAHAVAYFHAPDGLDRYPPLLAAAIAGGGYGVDLFFVLSAYLITELLLREHSLAGRIDVPAFYWRRALRIWPLYFVFLGFAFLVLPRVEPGLEGFEWQHGVAFALFVGNWSWVVLGMPHLVVAPLWSISVEEQFYLSWPWLLRLFSPRRLVLLAGLVIALGFAGRAWILRLGVEPERAWVSTFNHLDCIALGALVCLVVRRRTGRTPRAASALLCLGTIAAALMALTLVSFAYRARLGAAVDLFGPLVIAAACAAILVVWRSAPGWLGRLLHWRPLRYLGKISYGLYVFHFLALVVGARLVRRAVGPLETPLDFALYSAVALAGVVAVAALSYRFLESPFLRFKRRYTHVPSRPV